MHPFEHNRLKKNPWNCQIYAMANVMVTRQLSVYIKLIETTCLRSEAITFFCLEHIKYCFLSRRTREERRVEKWFLVPSSLYVRWLINSNLAGCNLGKQEELFDSRVRVNQSVSDAFVVKLNIDS